MSSDDFVRQVRQCIKECTELCKGETSENITHLRSNCYGEIVTLAKYVDGVRE